MRARDVMVTDVVTVGPEATVEQVAELLLERRISAVPVVDAENRIVGIVSEGDLLRRPEAGTDPRHWPLVEWLIPGPTLAAEFIKSHARRVSDVMTRGVVAVEPDTGLDKLVSLLERHRIKRVPVESGGKLVGIVSRADLLRVLSAYYKRAAAAAPVNDADLRKKILSELQRQAWSHPEQINVKVEDGAVELTGIVDSTAEKEAVRVVAEAIPGVKSVDAQVRVFHHQGYY